MTFLLKPPGILMIVTIVVGLIILGCCIGSLPGPILKEDEKMHEEYQKMEKTEKMEARLEKIGYPGRLDLWKHTVFLLIAVLAFLLTIALLVLLAIKGEESNLLPKLNALVCIILGILLLIGASILMAEWMRWKDFNIETSCVNLANSGSTAEDVQQEKKEVKKKCENEVKGIDDREDRFHKYCICENNSYYKYYVVITATVIGIIDALLYFVTAVLSFLYRPPNAVQ